MRSAYLAAFALYGYRYVLQPAFGPLRAAISDPDGTGFTPVLLQTSDGGALDPLIGEVTAPASLTRSPAVVFGPRLILLPPWRAPEDWFATLSKRVHNETAENLTSRTVKRPRDLTYAGD